MIKINNQIFLYILSSVFFINSTLGQNDSLKVHKKEYNHSISFNTIGLITLDYRLTYKNRFSNKFSFVSEVAYKFDSDNKSQSGSNFFQANPLASGNRIGNVGKRSDASLRIQLGRKFYISQGLYYRYLSIDSVSYNNGAGTTSDNYTIVYSERSHYIGIITQGGIEINIKLNSFQIVIEPYYRWLLLFPIDGYKDIHSYDSAYSHKIYNPPSQEKLDNKSMSYVGVNLGMRF